MYNKPCHDSAWMGMTQPQVMSMTPALTASTTQQLQRVSLCDTREVSDQAASNRMVQCDQVRRPRTVF